LSLCFRTGSCRAQDLVPRAYIVTPVHSNAVTLTYSHYGGGIQFEGSIPITAATAKVGIPVFSYSRSLNFLGRSGLFTASLPYGVGRFQGTVAGAETLAYRSGLLSPTIRFSANLVGGPAMNVEDYRKWRQKTILGASFKLVPPAGQYDPARLVNLGTNRWAFKPELGYSRRKGNWIIDAYGGVWFFTNNDNFYPGTATQSQSPTGSFETHLSYDFKPRLWVSLDGNFWFGGTTTINKLPNPLTVQRNSRVGATASIPITKHQSLKMSYNNGGREAISKP